MLFFASLLVTVRLPSHPSSKSLHQIWLWLVWFTEVPRPLKRDRWAVSLFPVHMQGWATQLLAPATYLPYRHECYMSSFLQNPTQEIESAYFQNCIIVMLLYNAIQLFFYKFMWLSVQYSSLFPFYPQSHCSISNPVRWKTKWSKQTLTLILYDCTVT